MLNFLLLGAIILVWVIALAIAALFLDVVYDKFEERVHAFIRFYRNADEQAYRDGWADHYNKKPHRYNSF